MSRRNGKLIRKIALDDLGISVDSPEYQAYWQRVNRKLDKIPDHYYNEFDKTIEDLKKNIKIFLL